MMTTTDLVNVIQAIPTMGDNVALSIKTRKRNALVLHALIMVGLNKKEDGIGAVLLENLPKECILELTELAHELLQKAGLAELNEAFKAVGKK